MTLNGTLTFQASFYTPQNVRFILHGLQVSFFLCDVCLCILYFPDCVRSVMWSYSTTCNLVFILKHLILTNMSGSTLNLPFLHLEKVNVLFVSFRIRHNLLYIISLLKILLITYYAILYTTDNFYKRYAIFINMHFIY